MKKYFVLITIFLACVFALGVVASEAQVIYGIKHPNATTTAYIYEIEADTCVNTLMASPTLPQAPTASWNGNAYDIVNDRYYFSQFDNNPKTLWMIENFSTTPGVAKAAGTLSASISNGTFYNGKYYYIGHLTDDLYEVTFDANGYVDSEVKLADITGDSKGFYFGDIAYSRTGVLYGSTTVGGTPTFFIYDGTYTDFTSTGAPEALQIAFGTDGVLYGYAISNNTFYTIDTLDGSITTKCTSDIGFSDLASDTPSEYSLCAGQTMNVGNVQVWNDGTDLYVKYNVNSPWCLNETHLHVATLSEDYIPQKNGNPQPGHFDYGDDELGCVSSWPQVIPLTDINASQGTNLYISAHAVVSDLSGNYATGEQICADFSTLAEGASVEGLGTVAEHLNIDATVGDAKKIVLATTNTNFAAYGAPNAACGNTPILNGGLDSNYNGFSDLAAKSAGLAHSYAFWFDAPITQFSLHMLDFGDYNPSRATTHLAEMKPSYLGVYGASETLTYESDGKVNPIYSDYGNLTCGTGDAVDANSGQPGNYTWQVSAEGIDKVELVFGTGYDPNIGFDSLCFITAGTETAWGNGPCDDGTLPFEGNNWATYFIYTVE